MLPVFDIFRVDADGTNCCAYADTLDGAKVRVQEFMAAWPAKYLVVNRITGQKICSQREQPRTEKGKERTTRAKGSSRHRGRNGFQHDSVKNFTGA